MKTNARLFASAAVLILHLGGGAVLHGADARSAYLDGAVAQGREDFALAVEKYKEALSLNPAYLEPMAGLAEAFFRMEEYEEASTYIALARTYDRNSPDLAVLEGRIRIGQGNVPAAVRCSTVCCWGSRTTWNRAWALRKPISRTASRRLRWTGMRRP